MQDKNLGLLRDIVPRHVWSCYNPPRGVHMFIYNEEYRTKYEWVIWDGIPKDVESCFQRPASSDLAAPGSPQATFYMQIKGHWFWSFFRHEGTGALDVKWIRGQRPPDRNQWRPGYAAAISFGIGTINGYKFIKSLCLRDGDHLFPIFMYMERDPQRSGSTQPEQLHLLACDRVPQSVVSTLDPSGFSPRRCCEAGHVTDPSRNQKMWQEGDNGPVTFQVQDHIFWVKHAGGPIYRKTGTLDTRRHGRWRPIGTLGTEAQDAEDPKNDVPDKWAFFLSDDELLGASFLD